MSKRVLEWALSCVRAAMSMGSGRFEIARVANCASSTRPKCASMIASVVGNTHLGERMTGEKLKRTLIAAVAASALTLASTELAAQTPAGTPTVRGAQSASRAGVIQYYNLNATELRLTQVQRAQIDKIADAYLNDVKQVPPIPQGAQPTPEVIQALLAPRRNLIAAMGRVLNAEQLRTFEASQQRRAIPRVVRGGADGSDPSRGIAR